jgi:hypothetical protein
VHYTIRQTATGWVLARATGDVLEQVGDEHSTYDTALAALAQVIAAELDTPDPTGADSEVGLLPEPWTSLAGGGICFSQETGDGRDFTGCTWSSRDPALSTLPLMLQTETDFGHFGAQLAGFIGEINVGDTPTASGRFYDNEAGIAFRDMLLDGRTFGVSVDPGPGTEAEFVCTEEDEDGWCIDGVTTFISYEIIGLTGTPFPAFAEAAIGLDSVAADAPVEQAASVVVAAATSVHAPVAPPAAWLALAEPQLGEPFLGTLGDEFLVDQGDGRLGCPVHITDDGQVFGHLATWGDCHVGFDHCVSPPTSASNYAHFHVGELLTAEGTRVSTGPLVVGCEHADASLFVEGARDHYAHTGMTWADARLSDGQFGPWVAGALRPDLNDVQLRVLRASVLSGDWRRVGASMELIGALACSGPGFAIAREALVASGLALKPEQRVTLRSKGGVPQTLLASGIVRRCPDCEKRAALARQGGNEDGETLRLLRVIEKRTRPMIPDAMRATAARIRGTS